MSGNDRIAAGILAGEELVSIRDISPFGEWSSVKLSRLIHDHEFPAILLAGDGKHHTTREAVVEWIRSGKGISGRADNGKPKKPAVDETNRRLRKHGLN